MEVILLNKQSLRYFGYRYSIELFSRAKSSKASVMRCSPKLGKRRICWESRSINLDGPWKARLAMPPRVIERIERAINSYWNWIGNQRLLMGALDCWVPSQQRPSSRRQMSAEKSSDSSKRPVHSNRLLKAFQMPVSSGDPAKQLTHDAFRSVDWIGSKAVAFPSIVSRTKCTH